MIWDKSTQYYSSPVHSRPEYFPCETVDFLSGKKTTYKIQTKYHYYSVLRWTKVVDVMLLREKSKKLLKAVVNSLQIAEQKWPMWTLWPKHFRHTFSWEIHGSLHGNLLPKQTIIAHNKETMWLIIRECFLHCRRYKNYRRRRQHFGQMST